MTQRKAVASPTSSAEYIKARKDAPRLLVPNHPDPPKVVSNIPLPSLAPRGGCRKFDHYYPFEDMKPGDSFWVPSDTQCTAGAISKFAKKSGWKFISRGQTEDGRANKEVGGAGKNRSHTLRGTRVWRVE